MSYCKNVAGGDAPEPGGRIVAPAQWDDLRFEPTTPNLLSPAGRIDYDTDELTADFQTSAVYPTDAFFATRQIPHAWKLESRIRPHCHWFQQQSVSPNWLVELRIYKNGQQVPALFEKFALTNSALASNAFVYGTGTLLQLSAHDYVSMDDTSPFGAIDSLSAAVDMKLYRDTTNASGLFTGADVYPGDAKLKEFDIHHLIDSSGSNSEFSKL